ncbi:MAG: metallophosphoesterase [Planctomycetaceae bacterium]|nr:metallophosphoesterase [Planctomycetaceae bacterium]
MGKCYFVSDLHLLANRSAAHQYLEQLSRTAQHAEVFVLGGDIFDFPWSGMPIQRAVARAVNWLLQLTASCPQCQFHLVLGNHDYHQVFIDRLVRLERQVPNLSWHRYYVRLGNSVFLHGDVANRRMDARGLAEARDRWLDKRRRGPFLSRLYDVVVLTRLHKPVAHLVFTKRTVVRRVLNYLESVGQGHGDGVRDVYFGHTHRRLSNYRYRGLQFHNGGAPIKGMKFRIVEARR